MKFALHFFVISILLFSAAAPSVRAQDQHAQHDHPILKKIDLAFQHKKLTLDQKVLYKFYAGRKREQLPSEFKPTNANPIKCGTPATRDFQENRSRLARSTIDEIQSLIQSPATQAVETYQSPSGKFTIRYETSGSNAVPADDSNNNSIPDYVEEVAAAADSSYRHEVQTLGYTDPIPSGESYLIEIVNLEFIYGQTYTTFDGTAIQIENDFSEGFPPNDDPEGDQIGAAKVTVAHEFKHAIQFKAAGWEGETGNWLEMDATLMEEVVYDNVNDYYNYLNSEDSIFSDPTQGFYPGSYYHVTWALYFEERYGPHFWPQVWDIIQANPEITMVNALSQQLGGSEAFRQAYNESQLWHFASGRNAASNFGFEERSNYPTPPTKEGEEFYTANFSVPRNSPQTSVNQFSARYYKLAGSGSKKGGMELETSSNGENQEIGLIAYKQDGSVETSTFILDDDKPTFKTPALNWDKINRLGLVLTNSGTSTQSSKESMIVGVGSDSVSSVDLYQNYPNPFNPSTEIRFNLQERTDVELKVYDTSGRLVQTLINEELPAGLYRQMFDGSGLASGVYLYQLVTGNKSIVKKMTLIK